MPPQKGPKTSSCERLLGKTDGKRQIPADVRHQCPDGCHFGRSDWIKRIALGRRQPFLDFGRRPTVLQKSPGLIDAQDGTAVQRFLREPVQPAQESYDRSPGEVFLGGALEQLSGFFKVAGLDAMLDRLLGPSLSFEPGGGGAMQAGNLGRVLLPESVTQQIGEQPVVAVPGASGVQRGDEQIGVFETFQHRSAVVAAG
jgi:hypothetical protein